MQLAPGRVCVSQVSHSKSDTAAETLDDICAEVLKSDTFSLLPCAREEK